jgi:hypothetical protein
MAKFNDKISTLINSQLPDFVVDDHPQFVQFLKTYFTFMESAEMQVTSIESTDGITLENETGRSDNLLLDGSKISSERTQLDAGDKIILEDSSFGKFTVGEIITGVTSNATATVVAEDLANNRIFTSAQDKFIKGEIVTGNSSNAQAIINSYRPNPVQNIQQLTNFRDPDKAISDFLTKFRDEFLKTIPENLAIGLNKRNLIKNIKSMYRLKGTQKGHELFFRILFNEISETFYPRTQMLRVSDGQWDTQKVLRAIANTGNTINLVGRTITGQTSGASAVVESVRKFILGNQEISEFIINNSTFVGTFTIGEEIRGTASDLDDYFIKADITGIPGTKTITNDGSLYTQADQITITGGGAGASLTINDVGTGGISEIIVDDGGSGYVTGDILNFTNTGTQGVNAAGFVAVVGGGFRQETGTTGTDGEDHIVLEDATTRGDQYTGDKIVQEIETGPSLGDVEGDITDIYLTNNGSGYLTLPIVTVTSSTGSGANVLAYGDEIGRVIGLKTNELGEGYEVSPTPPSIIFKNNLLLTTVTGSFVENDTVTGGTSGATGTIVSFNSNTNLLKLKDVVNSFDLDETITSTAGGSATLTRLDVASATVDVVSVADTDGKFLNEDGFVSESTMKIQDSLYYQDFSYVLKVGQSINNWRDSFKKTMHTAGFYFTGQVDLENRINLRIKAPVDGIISGVSESPIFSILNTLFSTLFGRRLGTVDDGTSLRANANIPADVDLNTDTVEHFTANTRDVTLKRPTLVIDYTSRVRRTIDNVNISQGFAYAGPRFGTINRFANTAFGINNSGSGITFQILNEIKVQGTRSSLDGRQGIFLMTSDAEGQKVKTNFALPTELAVSEPLFDNTLIKFDSDVFTMDNTNP